MRPRVRVASTGVPPRSRRKAAQGTSATAIRALWLKVEGEKREFLRDLDEEEELKLELGLGFDSREEEEE